MPANPARRTEARRMALRRSKLISEVFNSVKFKDSIEIREVDRRKIAF
jgi:hypothetical protein